MGLAVVGALNAWIDPFIQYRVPAYKPRFVNGYARHINAGLARHLDYDIVVVGSSYAMNFRNSDFDREFGGRTVSFAMPGMFVSEGAKAVSYALVQKRVKRVIFGLDFFAFVEKDNPYKFPDYLYDDSWVNDTPYLLNLETLKRSIYIALDRGPPNYNSDWDIPWSWATPKAQVSQEKAIADFADRRGKTSGAVSAYHLADMVRIADEKIVGLIERNPETEFELFLPPYSVLAWILYAEQGDLDHLLNFRLAIARLLSRYPNVRLHDFQAHRSLTCDLRHYVDVGHYGPDDNRMLVSQMRARTFVATPDTTRANNEEIRKLAAGRCDGAVVIP